MTARTLRFEDKERKTIALHALAFYKVGPGQITKWRCREGSALLDDYRLAHVRLLAEVANRIK